VAREQVYSFPETASISNSEVDSRFCYLNSSYLSKVAYSTYVVAAYTFWTHGVTKVGTIFDNKRRSFGRYSSLAEFSLLCQRYSSVLTRKSSCSYPCTCCKLSEHTLRLAAYGRGGCATTRPKNVALVTSAMTILISFVYQSVIIHRECSSN
jgi:hypothetical protein